MTDVSVAFDLTHLPAELLVHILGFLDGPDCGQRADADGEPEQRAAAQGGDGH